MGQGDSCQGNKLAGLINLFIVVILITAFIRTVTFMRGSLGSGNFISCDMHRDASGIFSCFYL